MMRQRLDAPRWPPGSTGRIWVAIPMVTIREYSTLCLKILTFVSLRVDVNFETFDDAFLPLENSYKFLPILFILYNRRIEKNSFTKVFC